MKTKTRTRCGEGADILRLGLYRCPACGAMLSIFSDEHKVTCYQCGEAVHRERVQPCLDWCALARQCLAKSK